MSTWLSNPGALATVMQPWAVVLQLQPAGAVLRAACQREGPGMQKAVSRYQGSSWEFPTPLLLYKP